MNRLPACFHAVLFGVAAACGGVLPASPCRADDPPAAETTSDDPSVKSQTSDLKSQLTDSGPSASPEATLALALLGSLTPEHMKQLGQMLEQDWKGRPEWGDMAVAILKSDRMRPGMGWWKPGIKRFDWSWLQGHFDADNDGNIDPSELPSELSKAEQLFTRLDRDLDGRVSAADLDPTETAGPMTPAGMSAMMASYLFYRLDKDSNGRVSLDELAEFFANADSEDLGFLTPDDLRIALDDPDSRKPTARGQGGEPPAAEMLRMFLTGQLGWLEAGPEIGEAAPDFSLTTHDGSSTVTLSDSCGKRPVVLIFGSFT